MHVTEKSTWASSQVPDLSGRRALITGADRGLGLEIAKALLARGCAVTMAGDQRDRADRAASALRTDHPSSEIEFEFLDLGDLESVATCAELIKNRHRTLDLLINNAGVMMLPYGTTAQGFERHFGINHLGHFALTGNLLPLLVATPGSRVVTMASSGHKMPGLTFADVRTEAGYKRHIAYGRSKLANLLFSQELARRLQATHSACLSVAAHPGQSATNPHRKGGIHPFIDRLIGQSAARGAQPAIRAATDPEARQGDYFGPAGLLEMRGAPVRVKPSPTALDPALAADLWRRSQEWTGISYLS